MNNQPKHDIFISYCRKDIEAVKAFKQEIEATTLATCWMDLESIDAGTHDYIESIINAINSCPVFLFMLTKEAQQSENALIELNFAYKKYRTEGKKVVIVYIEPCQMNDKFSFLYGLADTIDWQNPLQREKLIRNLKAWTNYEAKLAETHQEKERLALTEAEAQQRAEEVRKRREEEAQRKAEAEQRRKAELEREKAEEAQRRKEKKEKQKEQTAALFAKCISPFRKMKKSAIGWIVGIGAMIFLIFWAISQCSTTQIDREEKTIRIDSVEVDSVGEETAQIADIKKDSIQNYIEDAYSIQAIQEEELESAIEETQEETETTSIVIPSEKEINITTFKEPKSNVTNTIKEKEIVVNNSNPTPTITTEKNIVEDDKNDVAEIKKEKKGECIGTLEGHTKSVYSASFSPDGSRIVSASWDNTVRIWNAATGECIRTLEGHASEVNSASFSPDGSRIVSASSDKTLRIWDISDL